MGRLQLVFIIPFVLLSSCASIIAYEMLKPNPTNYGLHEFTMDNKSIWVANEHNDDKVIASIGSSLGSLTAVGEYLNESTEIRNKYLETDQALQQNPQAAIQNLLADRALVSQILIDLKVAGYKLINASTQEELQERYIRGFSFQDGNEVIRRISSYSEALRQARLTAINLNIAELEAQRQNNILSNSLTNSNNSMTGYGLLS